MALAGGGAKRWYALIFRGLLAIAAGIVALRFSAAAGRLLLASYFVADGALALALAAALTMPRRSRALFAADGAVDVIVAVVVLTWAPSAVSLVIAVASWAIATGGLEIGAAILMPRSPVLAWMIGAVGLLSCCAGILMIDWVDLAIAGMFYLFAAYAVVVGVLFVAFGVTILRAVRARSASPP